MHFDELCNYLLSFQKQQAANFFKNNYCFPDQELVDHYINKSTEKGLEFFIKGPFNLDFADAKVSLVIIIISSSSGSGNSSSCRRSGGGSGSGSGSTSGCGSGSKILTWTAK